MKAMAVIWICTLLAIFRVGMLVTTQMRAPVTAKVEPSSEPVALRFELIQIDPEHLPQLRPPGVVKPNYLQPLVVPYWWFEVKDKVCYKVQPTEALCFISTDRVPHVVDVVYALAKEQQKSKPVASKYKWTPISK